jgi:hypothetical protein
VKLIWLDLTVTKCMDGADSVVSVHTQQRKHWLPIIQTRTHGCWPALHSQHYQHQTDLLHMLLLSQYLKDPILHHLISSPLTPPKKLH